MKYICKENFEINNILIGNKGDVLEITDAVPKENETPENVAGYCDIKNTNTDQIYNATWMDVSDELEPVKLKATCIEWDTKGQDVLLPDEIELPENIEGDDYEAIDDYLSNMTEFCHKGYVLEESFSEGGK